MIHEFQDTYWYRYKSTYYSRHVFCMPNKSPTLKESQSLSVTVNTDPNATSESAYRVFPRKLRFYKDCTRHPLLRSHSTLMAEKLSYL